MLAIRNTFIAKQISPLEINRNSDGSFHDAKIFMQNDYGTIMQKKIIKYKM